MGPCYSFFEIAPADRIVVLSGKYKKKKKVFIPEMPKRAVRECSDTFTHARIIKKLSAPETILSVKSTVSTTGTKTCFRHLISTFIF